MTKENKISFWHAVYSRTSFTSSLLILIVSESILKTFFTEQQTLFCQIHCKSLHGFCRTSLAAELGIRSLSLDGVFSICLHLSSKLMAKLSSKHGGKSLQLFISDEIFCLGKWMAVSYLLEFLAKGLEICKCVKQRSCMSGRFINNTDFVHNCSV